MAKDAWSFISLLYDRYRKLFKRIFDCTEKRNMSNKWWEIVLEYEKGLEKYSYEDSSGSIENSSAAGSIVNAVQYWFSGGVWV